MSDEKINIGDYRRTGSSLSGNGQQLDVQRYFSREDINPYDSLKWIKSDVSIINENGKILFVQKDSEFPEQYSPLARQVVSSRYSYGEAGTSERETSLRDIIGRVSETYGKWAFEQGYMSERDAEVFKDEIATLTLRQMVSFNSPVWFNVGTDRYKSRIAPEKEEGYCITNGTAVRIGKGQTHIYPQTSACFIQSVDDTMEDIMDLARKEAFLFKFGSGTGTDLSTLRSSREKLSGGGKPSGPLAYEMFYDRVAGIVKSGGKTRRAAKMNSLKIWHPDIKEFIESKMIEEKKARILIKGGLNPKDASQTVAYQNVNFSVRVDDKFMNAVENNGETQTKPVHNHEMADEMPKYKAKDLLKLIAEGTYECGDPGMQYEDTINLWNTCSNSFWINASNPCSEYMAKDDSSCNLASANLQKFKDENKRFDVESYGNALKFLTWAMDMNYDKSGFPTQKIAQNSYYFRPLGVGYANLGSLILSEGLPYDSDEARTLAAVLTAFTTGKVFEISTEMAEKIGPFKEFEKNKDPMLKVMKMHRVGLEKIDRSKLPEGYEHVLDETKKVWDNVLYRGERFGFRNSQATVLAPTGTISFMMDCDTTGIEPDIALVKYKKLAEGGTLRMVNQTVPRALRKLGYEENQIDEMIKYVSGHEDIEFTPHLNEEHYAEIKNDRNNPNINLKEKLTKLGYPDEYADEMDVFIRGRETMEGAPYLKEEHLPVFDCALKVPNGKRFISYTGHIKMMAAVQPFISGAISKTVNIPEESTVDDIVNMYMDGWKLGLKSLSMYRDESKGWQPVTSSKKNDLEKIADELMPVRKKLKNVRDSRTHKFSIAGGAVEDKEGNLTPVNYEGYITVGFYENGNPGELFLTMAKEGSLVGGLMDCIGTLASMSLQYGAPLEVLEEKFKNAKFEPHGLVHEGLPDIKYANSLVEYIFGAAKEISNQYRKDKELITLLVERSGNLSDAEKKEIVERFTPLSKDSNGNSNENNEKNRNEIAGMCPNCESPLIKKPKGCELTCKCGYIDFTGCGG